MKDCDYEYRHEALYGQVGARDMGHAAGSALAAARDDVAMGDLQFRCTSPGACGHPGDWSYVADYLSR